MRSISRGDRELLVHDRRRALFLRQLQRDFPAGHGHLARHVLGERHDFGEPYFMHSMVMVRAQAQEAHAVAALAHDLVALLLQRQAVDLDHVVEHAGEHAHDLAVFPSRSALRR